jgi:thioredoxin 1
MAAELNAESFKTEVLDETAVSVLVDFWAPWCGPCRAQGPVLEDFAKESGGAIKVCKLNTDENADISRSYGVMSIPTLILFRNGQPVSKAVGLQSLQGLKKLVGIL